MNKSIFTDEQISQFKEKEQALVDEFIRKAVNDEIDPDDSYQCVEIYFLDSIFSTDMECDDTDSSCDHHGNCYEGFCVKGHEFGVSINGVPAKRLDYYGYDEDEDDNHE